MALRKFNSRQVGNKIKTIRLALNMSQEQFGIEAGNYSQDTVAMWESGRVPPALVLKQIAGISRPRRTVDWILDSGQSPQPIDIKANFGQIGFDVLRQLIREEITAAFKRVGLIAATKNAAHREKSPPQR
jgi:transcriptional regulator with XRE-family HTH domain